MWGGIDQIAQTPEVRARHRQAVLRRLLAELAPYRPQLFGLLVFTLINGAATAAGPWLVGLAIDDILLYQDIGRLIVIVGLLAGSYLLGLLAVRGQLLTVGGLGARVMAKLRGEVFAKIQRLPIAYFDTHASGDLQSRLVNDIDTLNQLLSPGLSQVLSVLFGLVGTLVAMAVLDWRLALACAPILPIMALTTNVFTRRARRAYRVTRKTVGAVSAVLEQDITGIREAQAFNRTEQNVRQFRELNAANRNANLQAVAITSAFSPAIDVLSTVGIAIVIGYGGFLALRGEIQVGVVAAFLLYVQQFFRPIQMLSQLAAQVQPALAGAERIYELLDQPEQEADPPLARPVGRLRGELVFDRVTFGYSPDRPVLHEISFEAAPGMTVALVGPTGAGKTTIASLAPRFYDVTHGAVRIDGIDVRDLRREDLRRNIGIVLQDPFLFSGTIAENIAFGKPDATDEEIRAAARAVFADRFIERLPAGYATRVSEAGRSLSQGQRQLISFARAVLADPSILILDEATSRVDTRTEALIQQALAVLLRGRTSLVIAHRLSTVRNADLILVINGGRIVERGRHPELLAAGGLYADLYRRQFRDPLPAIAGQNRFRSRAL
ncbi:MAG: ABC transporter ATP-binding protein [Chloroflexota bacterium]|nr:ABC transporter ATP-binding protein/permease [Dehalococcoidia bacterium]MDW8253512.1 ABC transporter ATP-binding protein [Chloroflexota bacterium]